MAQSAFAIIKKLSPPGSGLTTLQTRRLVHSLLLPVIAYEADLFVPNGAMAHRLDVLWHKTLRWATNCFSSIPVTILAAEVAIPPLSALFRHNRSMVAMAMACTPSHLNPAVARLPIDFPAPLPMRANDTSRPLAWKRRNTHHAQLTGPLPWRRDPSSGIRVHLPIDSLAHLAMPFLPSSGNLLARLTHLLPSDTPPTHSWPCVLAHDKIQAECCPRRGLESFGTSTGVLPVLPFTLPAFMELPKFLTGRIHQMRAGKSYLAAHRPAWQDETIAPKCPRCSSEDETFDHAFLSYRPRAWAKMCFLPTVTSLGQESPVWSTPALLVAMAKYIKATATGFSGGMPPLGTGSLTLESADDPLSQPTPSEGGQTHPAPATLTAAFAATWGASL